MAMGANMTASVSAHTGYEEATSSQRIAAVGSALIGVCGAVSAYTTIRWIGKRAHPVISVTYFATWSTIVSTIVQLAVPSIGFLFPKNWRDWGLLLLLG